MRLRSSVLLFSAVAAVFRVHASSAQTTSSPHGATIHGTVYDPDGRVVPGVTVNLLDSLVASCRDTDRFGGRI